MCGIFGLIGTPWQEHAAQGLAAIATRGPDAAEAWRDGEAWLGHRRLAVIDLDSGRQPMTSADGRHVIVFNGEIYNYAELRQELVRAGHVFRTRSDTEVLLEAWIAWGPAALARLDGMYAFAIWDGRSRQLVAARDRVGIKPLFYSAERGFAFASTLQPFLALPGFPRHLDYAAVRDYLGCQCINAPRSLLREVRQLPPAHLLRYDAASGGLALERYWTIPGPTEPAPAAADCLAAVDAALAASVRRQLVADVPLGAFLSGGIDSSLMVHYMSAASRSPVETFSMRFAEAGFDESAHAAAVAAHCGTRHHVIDAPAIGAATLLEAIAALDQPLADPAYITTYQLARLTREHVTVAISGDGGDELFGGYPRYLDVESAHPPRRLKAGLARAVAAGVLPGALLRRTLTGKELLLYRKLELGPWPTSRKSLARFLTPAALAAAEPTEVLREWRELASSFGGTWDTASLMRADLWSYLSENCLAKTDRASMAHGLEVRVPMLGNGVLDCVLGWPAAVHFDPGGKALLRQLARRHLPETVWNRPKHGFSVPLGSYFAAAWHEVCSDHIARAGSIAPFLDPAAVAATWRAALAGRGRRLAYSLVVLLVWLDRHAVAA